MLNISYEELRKEFKPMGSIDDEANRIANHLICELSITTGTSISNFLEVDSCFNNHMAIRIWVQNQLINLKGDTFDEKCQELKIKLYDSLPVY